MNHNIINPWQWQDKLGFVQANEFSQHHNVILCAGQTSMNDAGEPVHENDMESQLTLVLNNLELVLKQAGSTLSDVMRLNYYTTDVDLFFEKSDHFMQRLKEAGCRPASTLLGIERLAFPELLIEIEATAVR